MKKDERIIKYLEDELTPEERIAFENDLRNSTEMRAELEKYLTVKKETVNLKEVKLNQDYLNSIVPEFRTKLDLPKTTSIRRNLGYAFGVMLTFIIAAVILQKIFTESTEVNELQYFTESLDENQKVELLENLNGSLEDFYQISENNTEMVLTNLLQTGLKINYEVAEAYDINYSELVEGLSADEAEKIYDEILNKNFSEEVKL
jgi:hypothetical protein